MATTPRNVLAGSAVLLAAGLVWTVGFYGKPAKDRSPFSQNSAAAKEVRIRESGAHSAPAATEHAAKPATATAGTAAGKTQAREAAIERMNEAAVTYDAASLPVIKPYLVDPDPEVRKAAVNAMIVLGDAAAGPLLREAAKSAPSAREAVAMEDAADYVELPPANLSQMKERLKAARSQKKEPKK